MAPGLVAASRGEHVVLVRHGATQWSRSGRHTGRTDLPLDDGGRVQARHIASRLEGREIVAVYTSPLRRARETCSLAGLGERAVVDADLAEWDYGAFEGLTTAEIRERRPSWQLFVDGCDAGEQPADVAARCDRFLDQLSRIEGTVVVFAHGHVLRVLGARWIEQPASFGRYLALDTASLSELATDHEGRVLSRWNS